MEGKNETITPTVVDILTASSSGYALDLFTDKEVATLKIELKDDKPYLKCFVSGKDRPAKPEEIVRQLYLYKLMHDYGYPKERIAVEKGVYFGSTMAEKRADIVIFDKNEPDAAFVIVECKKPKRRGMDVSSSSPTATPKAHL
jgi:type I restriction enzyme M protein